MVFQNPDSTLNPSHSVEHAVLRPLRLLRGLSRAEAKAEAVRLLERVRLPADVLRRMPHQLSGGQRQRVALARAFAGEPELVIADEPVSALDVSVQAAIVNLLGDLQESSGIALLLISHDLALVRYMADQVAVMYLGRIVEYGPADIVFAPPYHPYTAALLAAAPRPDPDARGAGHHPRRQHAEPARPAEGLRLRHPLPPPHRRDLRHDAPARAPPRRRPQHRLPPGRSRTFRTSGFESLYLN